MNGGRRAEYCALRFTLPVVLSAVIFGGAVFGAFASTEPNHIAVGGFQETDRGLLDSLLSPDVGRSDRPKPGPAGGPEPQHGLPPAAAGLAGGCGDEGAAQPRVGGDTRDAAPTFGDATPGAAPTRGGPATRGEAGRGATDAGAGGGTDVREASPGKVAARTMEQAFNDVAGDVLPVVVEINVVEVVRQNIPRFDSPWQFFFGPPGFDEREFRKPGLGSGVIVRRDGRTVYVLSNNHVVGDADEISIRLHDGREYEGRIVGKDKRTDLALVSFQTRDDVPIARLGDSDRLEVGDWVLAVGNPFGFESTVTVGIVSALRRDPQPGARIADFTDYIQTDAAINPGNSGGALVSLDGEVIGINTWIASQSGGSVGLGFAIPINNAKRAIDDFIDMGRISYGWLGVTIEDIGSMPGLAGDLGLAPGGDDAEEVPGSLVTNVIVGSPADRDGILPGDFITAVAGRPVQDSRSLSRAVGLRPAGTRVPIELVRDGRTITVTVRLSEREEDDEREATLWPGFTVVPLSEEIREYLSLPSRRSGVVASGIAPDSPAAVAGIRRGDVFVSVSGEKVDSVREFYRELNDALGEVDFEILRDGIRLRLGIVKE